MADVVIRGTNDFQVPEYFNFADVIDEWAQKEKVKTGFYIKRIQNKDVTIVCNDYCSVKTPCILTF